MGECPMKNVILFGTIVIVIAGCATPGVNSSSYTKHDPKSVANEIQVDQPYSQAWDKLVRELSKSFYVINNIDKESRIINISFSSQTPSEFVDCGQTHRSYKHGDEMQSYDYNVADSSAYKYAGGVRESLSYYAIIRRTASLEGRSNIYLAPLENDKAKTTVTVNTRYILTIDTTGDAYAQHVNGNIFIQGQIPHPQPTIISFNTNSPAEHDFGEGVKVTCFSNGRLEKDVLQILQK
jgi:hypothetical protein